MTKKEEDRAKAIDAAKRYADSDFLFFDTETTGVDSNAEIVDIAFVDRDGRIVLESLVKPLRPIPAEVTAIHHVTNDMVADAPTFDQLLDQMAAVCAGRLLIAYNMAFDSKMLVQSARARGLSLELDPERLKCTMLIYAAYYGKWNSYRNSYKWIKLGEAAAQCGIEITGDLHRARVDADLGRQVLLHMAHNWG